MSLLCWVDILVADSVLLMELKSSIKMLTQNAQVDIL